MSSPFAIASLATSIAFAATAACAQDLAPEVQADDSVAAGLERLEAELGELREENQRLKADLEQIRELPAIAGRSSRYFHVSPLRRHGLVPLVPGTPPTGAAVAFEEPLPEGAVLPMEVPPPEAIDGGPIVPYPIEEYPSEFYEPAGEPAWVAHIDWLNWKASRDGLDFLISGNDADGAVGPGNVKRIRQGRNNGIRLGLFRRSPAGWDAGVRYTEIDSQGRNQVFSALAMMSATRIHPSGADLGDADISNAKSQYHLAYDLVDLEAGRWMSVGDAAAVRPFGGLRVARIDQDLHTMYSRFLTGDVVVVHEVSNMSSVGFLLGGDGHWHPGDGRWKLFGRAAAGLHV
ncbi:MAG: hypothetical protein KY476_25310, partial [Planctomycetes bacterium]|nr:hypothetical protein [Planctomycetota bacterium]